MDSNPLWSVMIPTYNAAKYLAKTLESVLVQALEDDRMEIVVVDNCSTDGTKSIVDSIGQGRIKWYQNNINIGMIGNFNKCVELAKGQIIHILNADDLVKEGYYNKLSALFEEHSNVGLVACGIEVIDDNGEFMHRLALCQSLIVPTNKVDELLYDNLLRTPAVSVRKSVYKAIGVFDSDFTFAFDWEMWVRAIANFGGLQTADYLCQYRHHTSSETARVTAANGEEFLDRARVMGRFEELNYPENKVNYRNHLKNMAFFQYKNLKKNNVNRNNIRSVYIKYASILDFIKDFYLSKFFNK